MAPARATTRLMTEPWVRRCRRLRRLAPSTIWVAFSARATSIRATAMSGADDLSELAAEHLEQAPLGRHQFADAWSTARCQL